MTKQEKRIILLKQTREAMRTNTVTCTCGVNKKAFQMYKCFYCGLFFCRICAKEHFEK